MKEITYEAGARERIDKYLAAYLALSRERVQTLIQRQAVLLNRQPVSPSRRLLPGDRIQVLAEAPGSSQTPPAETGDLDIVHENSEVLVVNKPAGLLTHPLPSRTSGTLLNRILAHTALSSVGAPLRPGVVHRLDRGTSGVMVFAKTDAAYWSLVEQFKNRQVEKTYLAVVQGVFGAATREVELAVTPRKEHPTRMRVRFLRGKKSLTKISLLRFFREESLLEVKPITGRTHQIRITLAHLGFPILGDSTYGVGSPFIQRTALHAQRLTFTHPVTSERLSFSVDPPADFADLLRHLEAWSPADKTPPFGRTGVVPNRG